MSDMSKIMELCRTAHYFSLDRTKFDSQRDAVRNMLPALCKKRAAIEADEATRRGLIVDPGRNMSLGVRHLRELPPAR